jgi:hypothetical protein
LKVPTEPRPVGHGLRNSSGSLAMLAAMRRASSRESGLVLRLRTEAARKKRVTNGLGVVLGTRRS